MSNKDNGAPAFPCQNNWDSGMSLRDWFAGQALKGMLSSGDGVDTEDGANNSTEPDDMALVAYEYADAMLEARRK